MPTQRGAPFRAALICLLGNTKHYITLPPYPSSPRGRFNPLQWAADPKRQDGVFDSYPSLPLVTLDGPASALIIGSLGTAGRSEDSVQHLDKPEHGNQLRASEVLVTTQIDIAWTLLFPRAGAIVTDVSALLSHAAIVAHELGIPAVFGCCNATRCSSPRQLILAGHSSVPLAAHAARISRFSRTFSSQLRRRDAVLILLAMDITRS